MSRTSCIAHRERQALAIVRQDYYELMHRDAVAAALLNIFEYWANGVLATEPDIERPWVGQRPIREFEQMLLGIATDKQIRKRLAVLTERGFIQTERPERRGMATAYRLMVPELQRALAVCSSSEAVEISFGQMTDGDALGSDSRGANGQMTDEALVIRPMGLGSNDRPLKNSSLKFKKERERTEDSSSSSSLEGKSAVVQVGTVQYAQPPESIEMAALWEENPPLAKRRLRQLAPGHRRLELVVHGFGRWWVGPGLNDFDEQLIQACRNRKRKFQQPDGASDAKTYINNMIRNEDWGNLALRCEEAEALRQRAAEVVQVAQAGQAGGANVRAGGWSEEARKASAVGLVRFKLRRGLVEEARAVARQVGIDLAVCRLSAAA